MKTWMAAPLLAALRVGCAPRMMGTVNTNSVMLSGFQFGPEDITVTAGTTVTCTNLDAAHTFDRAGTFPWFCTIHLALTATVQLTAP